jgi:hypothetical protein
MSFIQRFSKGVALAVTSVVLLVGITTNANSYWYVSGGGSWPGYYGTYYYPSYRYYRPVAYYPRYYGYPRYYRTNYYPRQYYPHYWHGNQGYRGYYRR